MVSNLKLSDYVATFLFEKGIKTDFSLSPARPTSIAHNDGLKLPKIPTDPEEKTRATLIL